MIVDIDIVHKDILHHLRVLVYRGMDQVSRNRSSKLSCHIYRVLLHEPDLNPYNSEDIKGYTSLLCELIL